MSLQTPPPLSPADQTLLLEIARESIAHGLKTGLPLSIKGQDYPGRLSEPGAAFVTLEMQHQLRGCIGSVEAYRPLVEDVCENAWQAAFRDPRFSELTSAEFPNLHLEISVLTEPEAMNVHSEDDLKNQLTPGRDGLILEDGYRRALFLPSVWEKLPSKDEFVGHLKQKAGMPRGYWSKSMKASRFHSFEFSGSDD